MIRVLQISEEKDLRGLMREIAVDSYGLRIMLPKGAFYLLKIDSISSISANILKQEMLSLGGEAAVSRDALTARARRTDCLLMGTLAQLASLGQKLKNQPFGLAQLAGDLSATLENYRRDAFVLKLGKYRLNLKKRTHIMGILNLTPDSFSGDGLSGRWQIEKIIEYAEKLVGEGADILDVGGESSRPGAKPVSVKEEIRRAIPAIKLLAKKIRAPISIDTYKPEVARAALDNGAAMVNDITGLRNPRMLRLIAKYKAAIVIMHMQGAPRTMQKEPRYRDLIAEIIDYLGRAIRLAQAAGIKEEKIIVDPGIGFGKSPEHNLQILQKLKDFKVLGRPLLAGPSRKSFIGKILGLAPQERLCGTLAACVLAAQNGAKILRAHDVRQVKQALKITDAILNS